MEEAAEFESPNTPADDATAFITAYHVENGPPYDHMGWYQLKIAVNVNAIHTPAMLPSRAGWCDAIFILQPEGGKTSQKTGGAIASEKTSGLTECYYRLEKQKS